MSFKISTNWISKYIERVCYNRQLWFGFEGLVRLVSMVTRLDDSVQLICPFKRVGSGRMGYTLVQLVNTSTILRVLWHFCIFRIKEKLLFFLFIKVSNRDWIVTFGATRGNDSIMALQRKSFEKQQLVHSNDVVKAQTQNKSKTQLHSTFLIQNSLEAPMALLRLPPISLQYVGHKSEQKTPNPGVSLTNLSLTISWSTPRLHLAKPRNLTSYFSATTQEPILEPSSSSEEISKTRLIAQNVPWTSTPEDIRSLFEKFGNVVDVEVSLSQFLLLFQTFKSLFIELLFLLDCVDVYAQEGKESRFGFH